MPDPSRSRGDASLLDVEREVRDFTRGFLFEGRVLKHQRSKMWADSIGSLRRELLALADNWWERDADDVRAALRRIAGEDR